VQYMKDYHDGFNDTINEHFSNMALFGMFMDNDLWTGTSDLARRYK
jgi:hypothetical protein